MKLMKLTKRPLLLVFLLESVRTLAWAGFGGPVPVGALLDRADLVVVAGLTQVTDGTSSEITQLQVIRILKGQAASLSLAATVLPGTRPAKGILPPSFIGARGIWFLKSNSGGYEVLPLFQGPFAGRDLFLPVQDASDVSPPSGTVGHQILTYQLRWYQSLPNPGPPEDERLFGSLIYNQGQDATDVIAALIGSVSVSQHTMGLAAAIRLGSSDALSQVANELNTLKSNPKFGTLVSTINAYPPQQTTASVVALEKLIALHSDIKGLDAAASTALAGIGNGTTTGRSPLPAKAVLPGMILLLDSKDPNAQLRAVRFLGYFALFADAPGNFPGTGVVGPLATADTRQFTPSKDAAITPAQYADFWKLWWSQNKAKFGF